MKKNGKNDRRDFLKGSLALTAASAVWSSAFRRSGLSTTPDRLKAELQTGEDPVVYFCPMHPDVQAKVPGKCPKCNMKLVAAKSSALGNEDFYLCPMHPDVMSNTPGVCPKCKMKLVKGAPPESGDFVVKIETSPRAPKAGDKVKFRFTIFHPMTGKQIKEFNLLHDMPLHFFIVSQDFEHFEHIHPEKQTDGSFTIETILPVAGYYKLFCDFFPAGGMPQVSHHNLVTAGFSGDLISSQARLVPDKSLVKTVQDMRIELKFEPAQPFSSKPATLHYHLVDQKSGEPVKDLQPYLGAWGHTLILSEDGTDYLHSHPTEMIPDEMDRTNLRGGPDIVFDTFFPRPANYRIWTQFQRHNQIITVAFTVAVPRLR
jgi:heavy metal-binding protein/TAT (twin-arginine translocation) pathway-exported protein